MIIIGIQILIMKPKQNNITVTIIKLSSLQAVELQSAKLITIAIGSHRLNDQYITFL